MTGVEIVAIVFQKFLNAGACHIQEFDFHLDGTKSVGKSLHNVLLPRACCLYHLVDGAVAAMQVLFREMLGKQIKHVSLLVEIQFLPVGGLAEEMERGGRLGHGGGVLLGWWIF